MAQRLKAVQHIHGRLRVDENWFLTDSSQMVAKQMIARENENFGRLKEAIKEEYEKFMKKTNQRRLESGMNPGEIIGGFYYNTGTEPPYAITRTNLATQNREEVFSLLDVQEIKRTPEKQRNTINAPVIRISDDENKIIALVDILSNDRPSLYVKDIKKQKIVVRKRQDSIPLASSAAWNKEGTGFYYTIPDTANRPHIVIYKKIAFHKLGAQSELDKKILEEKDEAFYLEMNETKDKKYTIMYSMSRVSSEITVIDRASGITRKVISKRPNTRYFLEHSRGYFYVITNHDSPEFKLIRFPTHSGLSQSEVVLEGDFCIDEVDMYEYHIVIYCREKGLPVVKIYDLTSGKCEDLKLPYKEAAFSIQPGSNLDYLSKDFTIIYSSPTVYEDTLVYNFSSKQVRISNHKKITGAPLKLSNLVTTRVEAASYDGVLIPMTLFHHKDILMNRKNRLLIKGYGAYGQKCDHSFKYTEMLAAEEGWVIANAHVRGEGEYGMSWHKEGTKEKKMNSFKDLIACAGELIHKGYTHPRLLAGYGTSAGGLLMAQVLNMQPWLFAAMVLEVPFVDPLSEMMNEELPLSVTDRDEWGDPLADPKIFDEIRSYAPYDNISYAEYPPLLVTGSVNDSRVSFVGILKYIRRMRIKSILRKQEKICENNIALHVTEGGHFGQGDLESEGIIWAFLNKVIKFPGI